MSKNSENSDQYCQHSLGVTNSCKELPEFLSEDNSEDASLIQTILYLLDPAFLLGWSLFAYAFSEFLFGHCLVR